MEYISKDILYAFVRMVKAKRLEKFTIDRFEQMVKDLIPHDVEEVKRGHWLYLGRDKSGISQYGCSECYRTIRSDESVVEMVYPYCHCGAKNKVRRR